MPRVHTRTKSRRGAERRCGRCGEPILPGETYFTWSFRYGGQRFNCHRHRPRQSELTQSLMGDVYAAIESAEDQLPGCEVISDIAALVEEVAGAAREVADQYEQAAEPFGGQGENQDRADELGGWADDLESFQPDEPSEDDSDAVVAETLERARDEAQELLNGCPL